MSRQTSFALILKRRDGLKGFGLRSVAEMAHLCESPIDTEEDEVCAIEEDEEEPHRGPGRVSLTKKTFEITQERYGICRTKSGDVSSVTAVA